MKRRSGGAHCCVQAGFGQNPRGAEAQEGIGYWITSLTPIVRTHCWRKALKAKKGFLDIPGGIWESPQSRGPREALRKERQEGTLVATSHKRWQWGKAPEEQNPKGVTGLE
jgi:hypothetical protein